MTDEQTQQRQLEYRTPEGMLRIYANNASVASTRFDVRIVFGEVIDVSDEKAVVENRVQVTMTWQEAKLLGDFLGANVKAFEELNGQIILPTIPPKIIVPETYPLK